MTARPSRPGSGAAAPFPIPGPGRRARNGWRGFGGRGRRTNHPSPAAPLSPDPQTDRGPQLPPRLALVSLLCVCFLLPSVCQLWGEGGALRPAPKTSPGPAVSGRPAHQPGSRGGTRVRPARGAAENPTAPTARSGVWGPHTSGAPRSPSAAHSPASSSCRLWLKVCSCRSLVSPLVRRNLEMKDTAAAISPIMVAARV